MFVGITKMIYYYTLLLINLNLLNYYMVIYKALDLKIIIDIYLYIYIYIYI